MVSLEWNDSLWYLIANHHAEDREKHVHRFSILCHLVELIEHSLGHEGLSKSEILILIQFCKVIQIMTVLNHFELLNELCHVR